MHLKIPCTIFIDFNDGFFGFLVFVKSGDFFGNGFGAVIGVFVDGEFFHGLGKNTREKTNYRNGESKQ